MKKPNFISMKEYDYPLPEDRIAKYPLVERDQSKLLIWDCGHIRHDKFLALDEVFQGDELLVLNDTKVIPARLYFQRSTGATIEIFLLHPHDPVDVQQTMQSKATVVWECTIGGLKKWKDDEILRAVLDAKHGEVVVEASLIDRDQKNVRISWNYHAWTFADLLDQIGQIPLPPYMNRQAEASDRHNYQTVYSKHDGAVAAPTAGLHFTPEVFNRLHSKGVRQEYLTLHVSAGTFRPVKSENALDHDMHFEQVIIEKAFVQKLINAKRVAAVGTTSLRTLESLYWYGVKLKQYGGCDFHLNADEAYELFDANEQLSKTEAFQCILNYMEAEGLQQISGETGIYIYPGYKFQVVDVLITNFHQPQSTLLLLIAAFTGEDHWKDIYKSALAEDYRFLSYGDASILIRK